MSGDDNHIEANVLIETANGSFYQHYKTGLTEFLDFALATGTDAIASGKLLVKDKIEVERGIARLSGPVVSDMLPLLAKIIDETNPSFNDECTIASIWEALGAIFLIAQHSGITDSAKVHSHTLQSKIARAAKQKNDDKNKLEQINKIRKSPTFKAAQHGDIKVEALANECGLSVSITRRRLKEMGRA